MADIADAARIQQAAEVLKNSTRVGQDVIAATKAIVTAANEFASLQSLAVDEADAAEFAARVAAAKASVAAQFAGLSPGGLAIVKSFLADLGL